VRNELDAVKAVDPAPTVAQYAYATEPVVRITTETVAVISAAALLNLITSSCK
jgi:hypothetical protein